MAPIGLVILWVIFTILGLVGNSLVILSVILSKKLRTVTNAFVVSLCVADLWTSLSYPWMAVAALGERGEWPLSSTAPCIIAAVQYHIGLGTRMYSLAAIALNRLLLTSRSKETYRWWYSPGKVAGMIAATWAIPGVVIFLPPALGVGELGFDNQDNTCTDIDNHPRGADFNRIQYACLYISPLIVILGCYTALYIIQKKRSVAKDDPTPDESEGPGGEMSASFTVVNESFQVTVSDTTAHDQRELDRLQLIITKNLFVVFLVFALLVSPYFVSVIFSTSSTFALYGKTISILNSCANPIVYAAGHPHFKAVLPRVALCRYSKIPDPSYCLQSLCCYQR